MKTNKKHDRVTRPRVNPYGAKGVCEIEGKYVVKVQHPGTTLILSKKFDNPVDANSYYGGFPYNQINF